MTCIGFSDLPEAYAGQPLRQAHARHPIMGGQFNRRLTLFREAMQRHQVPEEIAVHLLAHTEKLRPLVTAQPGSQCIQEAMGGPLISSWRPSTTPDQSSLEPDA